MQFRTLALTLSGLLAVAACDEPVSSTTTSEKLATTSEIAAEPAADDSAPGTTGSPPTGWDQKALDTADRLSDKVIAAGIPCDDYTVVPYRMYMEFGKAKRVLKDFLPSAEASCESDDDEDLTFIVFDSPERARGFVEKKRSMLCRRAKKMGILDFPGFPYVIADEWIVQPDERVTSVKIAPILGGVAEMASCNFDK